MTEKNLNALFADFAERLYQIADDDLPRVLLEGEQISGKKLRQPPESFIKENLIWDALEILGLEFRKEPYPFSGRERPDFEILNTSSAVLGECKRLNDIQKGERQMAEYLENAPSSTRHGVIVDGFTWRLISQGSIGVDEVLAEFRLKNWLVEYYSRNYPRFEWMAHELRQNNEPSRIVSRHTCYRFSTIFSKEGMDRRISHDNRETVTWRKLPLFRSNPSFDDTQAGRNARLDDFS